MKIDLIKSLFSTVNVLESREKLEMSSDILSSQVTNYKLSEIANYKDGLACFDINGVSYNTLFFPSENNSKKLYVSLTSGERTTQVKFTRWKWRKYFNGNVLFIDDPTASLYKNFSKIHPTWFFGSKSVNCCADVAKIIKEFISTHNIDVHDVIIFGSSAAGYASLIISNMISGVTSISLSPQINISKWKSSAYLRRMSNVDISKDIRNCVKLTDNNSVFFINFNILSPKDEPQIEQLLKDYNKNYDDLVYGINKLSPNVILWITACDGDKPHSSFPSEIEFVFIDSFIDSYRKNQIEIEWDFYNDNFVILSEMMNQKYSQKKKFLTKISKLETKLKNSKVAIEEIKEMYPSSRKSSFLSAPLVQKQLDIKKILNSSNTVIDVNDLSINNISKIDVSIDDIVLKIVTFKNNDKKQLNVFLSSNGNLNKYPSFDRFKWGALYDGITVCIADIVNIIGGNTFYLGNTKIDLQKYLIKLIIKLQDIWQVDNDKLYIISDSKGATGAINLSLSFPYSNCIAINPVVDLPKWFSKKKGFGSSKANFEKNTGFIIEDNLDNEKLYLKQIAKNSTSKFFIYYDIEDEFDREQYSILKSWLGFDSSSDVDFELIQPREKIMLFAVKIPYDSATPHLCFLDENVCKYCINLLKRGKIQDFDYDAFFAFYNLMKKQYKLIDEKKEISDKLVNL